MKVTYQEIIKTLESIKPANDKVMQDIIFISDTEQCKTSFIAITQNYQIIKTLDNIEYEQSDENISALINFKKLFDIVSLAKPLSGTTSFIYFKPNTDTHEMNCIIEKCQAENGQFVVLSRINQLVPYVDTSSKKNNAGLDLIDFATILSISDDSTSNEDTALFNTSYFINILGKMITGDATQLIISGQAKAIATANSNFTIYKETTAASITAVLETNVAKQMLTLLKNTKSESIIMHKTESQLIIADEFKLAVLQTPLLSSAKRAILSQINSFNSKDYAYGHLSLRRDLVLDTIRCFIGLTGQNKAIIRQLDDNVIEFKVIGSTGRENTTRLTIAKNLQGESIVGKDYVIDLSTFKQMLDTCDSTMILLSIAQADIEGEQAEKPQSLIKIASLEDNGVEGIRCFGVLE